MKKSISVLIAAVLICSFSVTSFAAVTITNQFTTPEGYNLFFGHFDNDDSEVGLKIDDTEYPLNSGKMETSRKYNNKFGIGIKYAGENLTGEAFTAFPYSKANGETTVAERGIKAYKDELPTVLNPEEYPLQGLKYCGVKDGIDRTPEFNKLLKEGSPIYTASVINQRSIKNIDSEFLNKSYISFYNMMWDDKSSEAYKTWVGDTGKLCDWYGFKLYKSATVTILATTDLSNSFEPYGFTKTTAASEGKAYYGEVYDGSADSGVDFTVKLTKHIDASYDNGVDVYLPNNIWNLANVWGMIAVIDYDDTTVAEPIKNINFVGYTGDDIDRTPVLGTFKEGQRAYTNADSTIANLKYDEKLGGKPYISLYNLRGKKTTEPEAYNAWGLDNVLKDWVTFDIYKSATIKVFTSGNIDALANKNYGFIKNTTTENDGKYFGLSDDEWGNYTSMYVKHYDVAYGLPETVKIPNAAWTDGARAFIIVIDFDEQPNRIVENPIRNLKTVGFKDGTDRTSALGVFKTGQKTYTNEEALISNIHKDALKYVGMPYIAPYSLRNRGTQEPDAVAVWGGNTLLDWQQFDIYQSATVRVFTASTISALENVNYGFKDNTLSDGGNYFVLSNDEWGKYSHMYTKHFEVDLGSFETVSIPNAAWSGGNPRPFVVVVDFDYKNEINNEVTEVAFNSSLCPELTEEVVKLDESLDVGDKFFFGFDELSVKNPDSTIAGKPFISLKRSKDITNEDAKTVWGNGQVDWATFKINKTAIIKLFPYDSNLLNHGSTGWTKSTEDKTWLIIKNDTWNTDQVTVKTMYEKVVEVVPGEFATVTLPNAPWHGKDKLAYIAVIDFIE